MSTKKELLEQNGILLLQHEQDQIEKKRLEFHINEKNQKIGKQRVKITQLESKHPIEIWVIDKLESLEVWIIKIFNRLKSLKLRKTSSIL